MAAPGAAAPRPLRGKSFYLDLPAGRSARELAEAIGRLGGALISRGKELLQKAMKNQDAGGGSSILASARLWGVQILHVDPGRLKPPFLKIEDESRQFRPFHHQFKTFPDLNFQAPKSSSPFEPPKSLSNSCRTRAAEGCPTRSEGEKSPRSTPVTVPKKKRGFCECCQETFEELHQHLQSPQHRRFALDDSQYAPVDRVIAQLTNGFMEPSDNSSSSSESDWDVQLLSTLTGVRDSRTQPVDRDLLQRTHVSVRDSGYESQLCSVLKQKSELAWAGKEDKNCRNCCTETKGASFPIFETFLGSWTS
ncbi:Dbf4b [Columba guinea]|nr:Dbf4b [Columba guinea]